MRELSPSDSGAPDARLTRRSLVAAAGILAAVGPAAAGKALAFSSSKSPKFNWGDGDKCHAKCAICFLRGTRLLTPGGEIAIEDLKIGDAVVTESGAVRAIRWIGRMTIERNGSEPWSDEVKPVRVAKDAFGVGSPHRDLYLSPAHMVHLNGVLMTVGDLVNGRTIAAVDVDAERLEYFHVELDTHDVLLAEGAPCESLLLAPERLWAFDNHAEYLALYGRPPEEAMAPYAPLASFNGGRSELKSRLRSAFAPMIDIRQPMDVVRDNIEVRALFSRAA